MRPGYLHALAAGAAILFGACAVTSQDNLVELRQREADSLFDSGLYADAIRLYEFVAESKPENKTVRVRLALCYEAVAQPYQSIHWYEEVRDELDSKDFFVLYRLAILYTETGFIPEAAATYRELARLRPEDPLPLQMYRSLVAEMGRTLPAGAAPAGYPPPRAGPLPGNLQAQADQADAISCRAGAEVQSLAQEPVPADPQARQAMRARAIGSLELLNQAWGLYHAVYLATNDGNLADKLRRIDQLRQFLGELIQILQGGLGP